MNRELENSVNYISNKTQKKSGFSAPENYFDSVEDSLFSKLSEQKFPSKSGHSIPEKYFENIDEVIFSKIEFPKTPKVISIRSRIIKYIPTAAAASLLLFFGLNYFALTNSNSFDDISPDDIENWLDNGYLDFNNE